RELHRQADPRGDHDPEEDDRAADEDDGQGVTDAPQGADEGGAPDLALAAHDRGDGDHVVGIGGVPHPEEEAQEDHREERGHPPYGGGRGPACQASRQGDADSWPRVLRYAPRATDTGQRRQTTQRRRDEIMANRPTIEKGRVARPVRIGLAALGLLLLSGPLASAQEGTLKKIKETGAITLGHRDASVPFS